MRPNLTINAGLRWEGHNSPPMLTPPGETPFAKYFTDPRFPTDTGEIPDDYGGWQPRLGITWDPTSDGRTVVRGTAGIFKARTPGLVWANPRTANGVIFANYTGVIVQTPDGNFNFGVPAFPTLVDTSNYPNTNPGVSVVDKDFQNPRSWQWSLSAEREIMPSMAVGRRLQLRQHRPPVQLLRPERRLFVHDQRRGAPHVWWCRDHPIGPSPTSARC